MRYVGGGVGARLGGGVLEGISKKYIKIKIGSERLTAHIKNILINSFSSLNLEKKFLEKN